MKVVVFLHLKHKAHPLQYNLYQNVPLTLGGCLRRAACVAGHSSLSWDKGVKITVVNTSETAVVRGTGGGVFARRAGG